MEGEGEKKFMHHYNMGINPFSVGEVKRIGSPNRRDIGHGNLVEISINGVLPTHEAFPYAIRVVSEVLAANASTSQAAVCATSMAMINAGVPIEPVAGIAMGLVTDHEDEKKFQVITDMRAVEDFYGEMDFKVAGTKNGITGIQMDTKLPGITMEIVEEALKQGKAARANILKKMSEVMPKEVVLSKYAPRIEVLHIEPENIGKLIGSGGKTINGIINKTGAQVDIEDDGTVMISSNDEAAVKAAMTEIEGMFKEVSVGDEFEGKVVKVAAFGAFVEILPGRDGMVHVSQMAPERVEDPSDVVSEGQIVKVRVTDVDSVTGKIGLSMLFGADIKEATERRPSSRPSFGDRSSRPSFGGDRPSRPSFGGGERRGFGGRPSSSSSSRPGMSDRRGRR
jgi:polyribonucleotide nucleotidyltransferase